MAAVMLMALHDDLGFRKQRLQRMKRGQELRYGGFREAVVGVRRKRDNDDG